MAVRVEYGGRGRQGPGPKVEEGEEEQGGHMDPGGREGWGSRGCPGRRLGRQCGG